MFCSYPQLSVDLPQFVDTFFRTQPFKGKFFILCGHKENLVSWLWFLKESAETCPLVTLSSSLLMWTFRHSTSLLWKPQKMWIWLSSQNIKCSWTWLSVWITSLVQLVWARLALSWASLNAWRVSSSSSVRDLALTVDRWALHTSHKHPYCDCFFFYSDTLFLSHWFFFDFYLNIINAILFKVLSWFSVRVKIFSTLYSQFLSLILNA